MNQCCNQDCNQGRACPARTSEAQDPQARIAQLEALLKFADERINKMLEDQPAAAPQAVQPFGYVNTYTGQFFSDVEPCRKTNDGHWRTVYTHPTQQGLDALTPAARDVLSERKRQIDTEGWKPERDDVYDTGEMALAAACYAAHSASCAAIRAPHTAPGVFMRTRSAQDFVGEMWPWSADWWKPSGHRRNLEKAAALIMAEIERIDRAALAAQAKQGGV